MDKQFYVYLLGNGRNGTLYIGVTSRLVARIYQHKQELAPGFTSRYKIKNLLWYEAHESAESAITREKTTKKVAPAMEDEPDREHESLLAGFVR